MRRRLGLLAVLGALAGAADTQAGSIFVDYQITGGTFFTASTPPPFDMTATGGTFRVRFGHAVGPNTFSLTPYQSGNDGSMLSLHVVGINQQLQLLGVITDFFFFFSLASESAMFFTAPNGPLSWRDGPALSQLWPRVEAEIKLSPFFGAVRLRGFFTFFPRPGETSEYYGGLSLLGQEISRTFVPTSEPRAAWMALTSLALGAAALARARRSV
jgi:hypothetical protein